MAGGKMIHRMLDRNSAHRKQLLRNLVTALFQHESISTTWPKAKEAQRMAEKLVTLAKKNTEASKRRAHEILYTPIEMVPRLFGDIRQRYATRPGGYTRVLRIEPLKEDQAPSAILELVDGPKDMRFALTAQSVARDRMLGRAHSAMTLTNKKNCLMFRENGEEEFETKVQEFIALEKEGQDAPEPKKEKLRGKIEARPDSSYLIRHKHRRTAVYRQQFEYT